MTVVFLQILWLSDDATPTTPSPRPSASGTQMGQGGLVPELSLGTSGSAKPTPARPQQTSPDPEFATEVKKISRQSAALLSFSRRHFQQHTPLLVSPTGGAAHPSGGGPEPDRQGQLHGWHGEGEERPLRQDPRGWYHLPKPHHQRKPQPHLERALRGLFNAPRSLCFLTCSFQPTHV